MISRGAGYSLFVLNWSWQGAKNVYRFALATLCICHGDDMLGLMLNFRKLDDRRTLAKYPKTAVLLCGISKFFVQSIYTLIGIESHVAIFVFR
jgi:hypothetical protein